MAIITVQMEGTPGLTYKAIPSNGDISTYVASGISAVPVSGQLGRFTLALNDAVSTLWTVFEGSAQPAHWGLWYRKYDLDAVDAATVTDIESQLEAIQAKTNLIGNATVAVVAMVSPIGEIASPLVIGDDYLEANGRAFTWEIPAIAGVTVGTATAHFGGKIINGDDSWLATGTVSDLGAGQWRISVDLPKASTINLTPGRYRWSCEVRSSTGVEITRVRNAGDTKTVMLVNKQT